MKNLNLLTRTTSRCRMFNHPLWLAMVWGMVIAALLWAPVGPQYSFSVTQPPAVLLVADSATALKAGDSAIKNRLQTLGYTVTVKADTTVLTSDANGKALVLISSTAAHQNVNTKFRTVTVPVLTWEKQLFNPLGMTGSSASDLGTLNSQTQLVIINPTHSMASGLSGTVTVTSSTNDFNWGKPNSNGIKIATLVELLPSKEGRTHNHGEEITLPKQIRSLSPKPAQFTLMPPYLA